MAPISIHRPLTTMRTTFGGTHFDLGKRGPARSVPPPSPEGDSP